MSNEPPAATTAATPPVPGSGGANAPAGGSAPVPEQPHQSSKNLDQTYVVGQSESDIKKPDWTVRAIAVSVVLNKAALGATSTDQVKAAIAGAFAYPQVNVNVLAAPFRGGSAQAGPAGLIQAAAPVSRALLEVVAAAALLFGIAMPLGRRLGTLGTIAPLPPVMARPVAVALAGGGGADLRGQVTKDPLNAARLLQSWAEEDE